MNHEEFDENVHVSLPLGEANKIGAILMAYYQACQAQSLNARETGRHELAMQADQSAQYAYHMMEVLGLAVIDSMMSVDRDEADAYFGLKIDERDIADPEVIRAANEALSAPLDENWDIVGDVESFLRETNGGE